MTESSFLEKPSLSKQDLPEKTKSKKMSRLKQSLAIIKSGDLIGVRHRAGAETISSMSGNVVASSPDKLEVILQDNKHFVELVLNEDSEVFKL